MFKFYLKKTVEKGRRLLFLFLMCFYQFVYQANIVFAAKGGTTTQTITTQQLSEKINSAVAWIQGILLALAIISVIIYFAIPHITGGEEGARNARKNVRNIIIGLIVGILAAPLGGTVYSWITGS